MLFVDDSPLPAWYSGGDGDESSVSGWCQGIAQAGEDPRNVRVTGRELVMDVLQAGQAWVLGFLLNLVVPILVWATVIAGLVLVVRDKIEKEDLVGFLSKRRADSENLEAWCELHDAGVTTR